VLSDSFGGITAVASFGAKALVANALTGGITAFLKTGDQAMVAKERAPGVTVVSATSLT